MLGRCKSAGVAGAGSVFIYIFLFLLAVVEKKEESSLPRRLLLCPSVRDELVYCPAVVVEDRCWSCCFPQRPPVARAKFVAINAAHNVNNIFEENKESQ